jgi:hypothetical protein
MSLLAFSLLLTRNVGGPYDSDVLSEDSIVKALYAVISGPAGQQRDWDRMRFLFSHEAHLVALGHRKNGSPYEIAMTVDGYVGQSGPYLETHGFFEREVAHRRENFGNLTELWSTYESREKLDDKKPFERGVNAIQLANDGKRWWIVSLTWQGEDEHTQLPRKYLHSAG